jgi:HD-GYP domain-containing protein (c-di-GMP phosphodiesterase class II)
MSLNQLEYESMNMQIANFERMLQIDTELNKMQDFDLLLEFILLEARRMVHADAGSIYVREQVLEKNELIEKLAIKYSQNDTLSSRLPEGEKLIYSLFSIPINEKTVSGYCALTRNLINIPDMYHIPKDAPYFFNASYDMMSGYKSTSSLTVPLVNADEQLLGVIQILNALDPEGKAIPFSKEDESLVTYFANTASMALQRSYTTRTMVLRTVKMAELRDPKETGVHVRRVADYSIEMYDRWAYRHKVSAVERKKFKDIFRIAAMLHDVGKVAISDTILKKPGRFTPEEYLIMQQHTVYGASLFNDAPSPLDTLSRDVALTHHENWDGSGYPGWVDPATGRTIKTGEDGKPLGRRGEEIPLAGRIVALADVYDALCSRRVYKDPWGEREVFAEIKRVRGIKFDPELVDIFFDILPSIKQIQEHYKEPDPPAL